MSVGFSFAYFAQFAIASTEWIAISAQVLFTFAILELLPAGHAGAFAALSLVPVATALALADWRRWRPLPPIAAIAAWISVLVWTGPHGRYLVLASATVAFLAWLGWIVWQTLKRRLECGVEELLLLLANAGFYFAVGYRVIHRDAAPLCGLFTVAVAAAHLAAALLIRSRLRVAERAQMLAAGVALTFLTLAIPIPVIGRPSPGRGKRPRWPGSPDV